MTERVGDAFKADREKGSWWKPFDFCFAEVHSRAVLPKFLEIVSENG